MKSKRESYAKRLNGRVNERQEKAIKRHCKRKGTTISRILRELADSLTKGDRKSASA